MINEMDEGRERASSTENSREAEMESLPYASECSLNYN